ncbi:MAG: hypothetical protein I3273_01190 [Candidatus Moeniiplasma glomeromycotorum]|nr:hypothetical protein [Candidatus Moeniiplasma glomeromycotorum]MCE8167263.1 hypothetical protein [Candidatus Moeniiplasma glomeromycotorum]MCE8168724.1 hypothetical protein [Candidatus Moeniiplasma glomeromycotorum]
MTQINLNNLNTIAEAKAAEYNGQQLSTDAEKNIFDNSLLKPSGTLDVNLLRQTALLLEKVKKAEVATAKDATLLSGLETAKNGNAVPYQVVNSLNTQVNSAITKLQGLPADKTESQLQTELDNATAKVAKYTKESTEKQTEINDFVKDTAAPNRIKLQQAENRRKGIDVLIDELVDRGTSDINGKKILDAVKQKYIDFTESYETSKLHETKISYSSGRKYVGTNGIYKTYFRILEIIKELDEASLKSSIEGVLSTSDAKKVKDAYDRLKGTKYTKNIFGWVEDPNPSFKNPEPKNYKFDPKQWPTVRIEFKDIATFISTLFPKGSWSSSPLLDPSKSLRLKGPNNTEILEKSYEILWNGFRRIPSTNMVATGWSISKFSPQDLKPEKIQLVWKAGAASIIKFFWDVFPGNETDIVSFNALVDKDGNDLAVERTVLERDKRFLRNVEADTAFLRHNYMLHMEEKVKTATEPVTGKLLNLKFDDKWKEVVNKVFDSAQETSTYYINKKVSLTQDELNKYYLTINESGDYNLNLYENFRIESIIEEMSAKAVVESDDSILTAMRNEKKDIDANLRQAKIEESLAKKALDNKKGMTLPQLKEKFKIIYKTGPDSNKYTYEEFSEMYDDLLVRIQDSMPGKKLDTEFAGYKQQLEEKIVNKLLVPLSIVYPWLELDESLEKRIEKRKKNNPYFDVEKGLKKIKEAIEQIEKIRGLTPREANELDRIKNYKKPLPQSDLDGPKLNAILHTTGISDTELFLTTWKGLGGSLNTETGLKKLIGDYYKGSGKPEEGGLKEHLNHTDWTGKWGGKKFSGDNYWEDLIKAGPEYVIGAIKHYEWENKKGEYDTDDKKNAVTTEMTQMNEKDGKDEGDKKIQVDAKWDTTKGSHIAQFLYRKAVGKTGLDLIKAHTLVEKKKKDDKTESGILKHLKDNWYWYALGGAILIAIGVAVWIFWENIVNWWNPPMENTDEDKSNE